MGPDFSILLIKQSQTSPDAFSSMFELMFIRDISQEMVHTRSLQTNTKALSCMTTAQGDLPMTCCMESLLSLHVKDQICAS